MRTAVRAGVFLVGMALAWAGCGGSARLQKELILATTTSLQDSGLLDMLVPLFERESGYEVKTIAVGTGQALKMAERGEADVVLAHAPEAEKKLVEKGAVVDRRLVMYNDFVIVGPPDDPARVRGMESASHAMRRIAEKGALFVSRGDDSGTHKKEWRLWRLAGIRPGGKWYQEAGLGMGRTLDVASEKEAYTLTDRATFLSLRKNLRLEILVEGDPALLNLYHVMRVDPKRFDKVNDAGARAWERFLLSPEVQERIGQYGREQYGRSLFVPAAGRSEEELLSRAPESGT